MNKQMKKKARKQKQKKQKNQELIQIQKPGLWEKKKSHEAIIEIFNMRIQEKKDKGIEKNK